MLNGGIRTENQRLNTSLLIELIIWPFTPTLSSSLKTGPLVYLRPKVALLLTMLAREQRLYRNILKSKTRKVKNLSVESLFLRMVRGDIMIAKNTSTMKTTFLTGKRLAICSKNLHIIFSKIMLQFYE